MRLRTIVATAALLVPALFGPALAAEIDTARGPVDVVDVPERVAVYDIAAIDTLDLLGIRPAGIPDRLYLPELAHLAADAEVVGTLFEPDLEALNALAPDLVIVGLRSSPMVEATSRVAPTIDMTIEGTDLLAAARRRLAAYGALFHREQEAARAAAAFDAAIGRTRAAIAGKGRGLVVLVNGPKISVYGPNSRFGWIHTDLGLPPAVDLAGTAVHGEAVSFEFIRQADPDWLVVLDRTVATGEGAASAAGTLDNELVAATTAWREGQVVYLPPADVYIAAGGIAATTRVLAALEHGFSRAP